MTKNELSIPHSDTIFPADIHPNVRLGESLYFNPRENSEYHAGDSDLPSVRIRPLDEFEDCSGILILSTVGE